MVAKFYNAKRWYSYCVLLFECVLFITGASEVTQFHPISLNYTRHKRQTEGGGCVLPRYPEHGKWKLLNAVSKPGDTVPEDSFIKFECTSGYKLSVENPYTVCADKWTPSKFPECERLCPPLYTSSTFDLKCSDKRGREIECSGGTEGAYVEYTCAPYYETPFGYKKTLNCADGKWSQKPMCQPVCGKKIGPEAKKMIVGVRPNEKLENPWVTALYQKLNGSFEYICGGSILSVRVVLTAAHCVTNDYGDVLPKEDYSVGAGKLYSKYKAPEDTQAQYLEIFKIIVHKDYKANLRNFLADFAVLVTQGEFTLNDVVQPVCFNNMNTIYLHPGNNGEVSAWGQTEDELPSVKLRTLRIPYKYEVTCAEELPSEWANKYNIIDKICAGLVNQNTSVCEGDSGSGFTFENPDDNRYYIHGIVSIGPFVGDTCNIQQNSLYTKVAFYYEYIDRLLTIYSSDVKDCKLPPYPPNGRWTIEGQKKKPGDAVSSNTILKVECNEGFMLLSSSPNVNCGSAFVLPKCQTLCPPLRFPKGTDYRCTNKNRQVINCSQAVDESSLWYACSKGYRIPKGRTNTAICINASWGSNPPECRRPIEDCGIKGDGANETDGLEYPWNAILYQKEHRENSTLKYVYLCGATILSHKVVLTGATCVADEFGMTLAKERFLIGTGRVFENYKDPREFQTQYTEVSRIIKHQDYRGYYRHYVADFALLIVSTPFTFNKFVRPACFFDINSIHLQPKDLGMVWKFKDGRQEVFEIPYQSQLTCEKEFPRSFGDKFLVLDKLCIGFDNKTSTLCRHGSGRGFVVKNPEDDRYYVHGLSSVGSYSNPEPNGMECHHYKLYTSVGFYYDFIENVLLENQ